MPLSCYKVTFSAVFASSFQKAIDVNPIMASFLHETIDVNLVKVSFLHETINENPLKVSFLKEGITGITANPSCMKDFNVTYTTSIFLLHGVNTRIVVLTPAITASFTAFPLEDAMAWRYFQIAILLILKAIKRKSVIQNWHF